MEGREGHPDMGGREGGGREGGDRRACREGGRGTPQRGACREGVALHVTEGGMQGGRRAHRRRRGGGTPPARRRRAPAAPAAAPRRTRPPGAEACVCVCVFVCGRVYLHRAEHAHLTPRGAVGRPHRREDERVAQLRHREDPERGPEEAVPSALRGGGMRRYPCGVRAEQQGSQQAAVGCGSTKERPGSPPARHGAWAQSINPPRRSGA